MQIGICLLGLQLIILGLELQVNRVNDGRVGVLHLLLNFEC